MLFGILLCIELKLPSNSGLIWLYWNHLSGYFFFFKFLPFLKFKSIFSLRCVYFIVFFPFSSHYFNCNIALLWNVFLWMPCKWFTPAKLLWALLRVFWSSSSCINKASIKVAFVFHKQFQEVFKSENIEHNSLHIFTPTLHNSLPWFSSKCHEFDHGYTLVWVMHMLPGFGSRSPWN